MTYHFTTTRLWSNEQKMASIAEAVEKVETLYIAGGNVK